MRDVRWAEMVTPVRNPLGAVVSRTFESCSRAGRCRAPDGDHEILKFQTAFADRRDSAETIMLAREGSGWRMVGYFIR